MNITLIVGLPGSGKSHLAEVMKTESCVVVDDITTQDSLPKDIDYLIITDVNFCDADILGKATVILNRKYVGTKIEIIYFENDPGKARENVQFRNDGRNVEGTIKRFEKIYDPPKNAMEIWQNTN